MLTLFISGTVVELEKAHAAERLSEREHHQNKVRENNELQRQLLELQVLYFKTLLHKAVAIIPIIIHPAVSIIPIIKQLFC